MKLTFNFSFLFDVFRVSSILSFLLLILYFVFPALPHVNIDGYINENELLGIIINTVFLMLSLFLFFLLFKLMISWVFVGSINRIRVKNGYQFIFNDSRFIKRINLVELKIDVVKDVTRTSIIDMNNKPIYNPPAKKIVNGIVMFHVPNRIIKEAFRSNKKLWLSIKLYKYFEFNRCFHV